MTMVASTPGEARQAEETAARVHVRRTSEQRRSSDLLQFATLRDCRVLLEQLAEDWGDGFGSSSQGNGSPSRRSNAPADPVLAAYLAAGHGNELADACRAVKARIDALLGEVHGLARDARRLLPLDHPKAEMLARHEQARFTGAGKCDRCNEPVTGGAGVVVVDGVAKEDKLQGAYCPACYSAWRKSGLDRGAFNATWSAEKAERRARQRARAAGSGGVAVGIETAGASTDAADGVQLRASGGPVRPDHDDGGDSR